MASDAMKRTPTAQVFDVDSIPIPPGTKSHVRLPRGLEPEPLPARAWWLVGASAIIMLMAGIAIGKFLLP